MKVPTLEILGRQLVVGLGRVASRAAVRAGQSVTTDIQKVGQEVQRRAAETAKKLEKLIDEDEQ